MKRTVTNDFEKIKIASASTNKAACNLYYDSFEIEKVRIQNFNYDQKVGIDSYIDFEDVLRIAADCMTGKIFKDIEKAAAENKQYSLGYKGSKSSPNYDGKPESRQITFGKSNDTIFINMIRCEGVRDPEKGTIKPNPNRDKAKDLKLSVGMTVEKFRSIFFMADAYIRGYMSREVPRLVMEAEEKAAAAKKNTNTTSENN
jgi:hypothetical protein